MSRESFIAAAMEVAKGAYEADHFARGDEAAVPKWDLLTIDGKNSIMYQCIMTCDGNPLPTYTLDDLRMMGIPEHSECGRKMLKITPGNKAFNDFALSQKDKLERARK